MTKKLAIIGAGHLAKIYADRCKELGVKSHCFAWGKGAIARDSVDVFHEISVTEVDEILSICREIGIDGVVATTELTVYPCAYVADGLGTPGITPEVARGITNKYRNREASKDVEGLLQPQYRLYDGDISSFSDGLEYPVVIKPTSEGGKRGVTVVCNQNDLKEAVAYAEKEKKEHRKSLPNRSFRREWSARWRASRSMEWHVLFRLRKNGARARLTALNSGIINLLLCLLTFAARWKTLFLGRLSQLAC